MENTKYDIFISYRRSGGAPFARILQLMLSQRGFITFLDYDELKDGVFHKKIIDSIASAPIFIIILSENALDRCEDENDSVRKEFTEALRLGKKIIPVNPDKMFNGIHTDVPEDIRNAVTELQHSDIFFGQALGVTVDQMIKNRIEPVTGPRCQGSKVDNNYDDAVRRLTKLDIYHRRIKRLVIISVIIIILFIVIGVIFYNTFNERQDKLRYLNELRENIQNRHSHFNPSLRTDLSERKLLAIDSILSRMVILKDGEVWIDQMEFTRGNWADIMDEECNPSQRRLPITNKPFYEIIEMMKDSLYDMTGIEFDLPSADEWLYAANGGSYQHHYLFSGSNDADSVAWYVGNSGKKVHPVAEATKIPNYLDLYDMSGNVAELCNSSYTSPDNQEYWIVCGGHYLSPIEDIKINAQNHLPLDGANNRTGFRLVIRMNN